MKKTNIWLNIFLTVLLTCRQVWPAEMKHWRLLPADPAEILKPSPPAPKDSGEFNRFLEEKKFFKFSQERWNQAQKPETVKPDVTVPAPAPPSTQELAFDLPYESRLSISGRKFIGLKFAYTNPNSSVEGKKISKEFDMKQELQVRIKGKVGKKVDVNVNFDDTTENKRDISVVYRGDPDEIVQEAAFGDIDLSLPGSPKFVTYTSNKQLFGLKIKTKIKNFEFTGIGSRSKGVTETKIYTGNTQFDKKEISDTSYIRRKYYKFVLEDSHLATVVKGSERIYLDDRSPNTYTVNTSTVTAVPYKVSGSSYTGSFDLLNSGKDYSIDYSTGVITFRSTLQTNYVLAVDYQYKNSGGETVWASSGGPTPAATRYLIKDENETAAITRELKNYYSIGVSKIIRDNGRGNFIFNVLDLNRNVVTSLRYPNDVEIDFETGIFNFRKEKPFDAGVYNQTPSHFNTISIEYRYRIKIFSLRPGIILGSETIVLDSRTLKRDEDYFIDYDSGMVTFYREDDIREDSRLEITYEYSPFGAQLQQTLAGGRATYSFGPNFSIGSTAIYNIPSKTSTVPALRSAPESSQILEGDLRLNINPEWSPLKITNLVVEGAQSTFNPNISGRAIIENMEGIKLEESAPTSKEAWQLSSNPNRVPTRRENVKIENNEIKVVENEEIKVLEINPGLKLENKEETQQVLKFNYQLYSSSQQISIIHVLSTAGLDFSRKLFIEGWIYGDNGGETFDIGLGGFNEDADGNNSIDTEDLNRNGSLDRDEDKGWKFNAADGVFPIGASNGRIDSENLGRALTYDDGMGGSFSALTDKNGVTHSTIDWQGWQFFRIPLNITPANQESWKIIRQIRLTIGGVNGNGALKIASLSVTGNKWEEPLILPAGAGSMEVSAVSNEEDSKVGDIFSLTDFKNDLYKDTDLNEFKREQVLRLTYSNLQAGTTALTKVIFSRAQDYSNYRNFKFFLYPKDTHGETFFIRLGSETDYFEYESVPANSGWQAITASFIDANADGRPDDLNWNIVGNPKKNNISQIVLGIKNTTDDTIPNGEIWVNDLYLNDVISKKGTARGVSGNWSLNLPDWTGANRDWLSGYLNREIKTRNFRILDAQVTNQDYHTTSGNFNLTYFNWLPITGNLAKTITVTPTAQDNPLLSSTIEGRLVNSSKDFGFNLNLNRLPGFSGNYANTTLANSELYLREVKDTYTGKMSYTNPWELDLLPTKYLDFHPLPSAVNLSYTRSNYFIYRDTGARTGAGLENTKEFSTTYVGDLQFQWWNGFTFTPNYSLKQVWEKKYLYAIPKVRTFDSDTVDYYPKSLSQIISAASNWRILKWLSPAINYRMNVEETYQLTVSSATQRTEARTKVVVRTLNGGINYTFSPRELFPKFKPTQTLNLNSSYNIEDGDSFDNLDSGYNFYKLKDRQKTNFKNSLWIRGVPTYNPEANRKQFTTKDTLNSSLTWTPFGALSFSNQFSCIKSITASATYNRSKYHQENNNNSSSQDTLTTRWPDLTVGISALEKLFFIPPKFISDSQLNLTYSIKSADNKNISHSLERNKGGDFRFTCFKIFTPFTKYNLSEITEKTLVKDTGKWIPSKLGLTRAWSAQLGIRAKQWLFTPRYDTSLSQTRDFTGNYTQHLINKTPSLQVHSDFNLPASWKIPFTRKYLRFANRLIFDCTFKLDLKRSEFNVLENNDTYSLDLKTNYNISDNLQLDLGGGGSKTYDRRPGIEAGKKEEPFTVNVSAGLNIKF
ncbi:MAG: hypothetical protein ABII74_09995 [Elusimicrobiota bacterium]